MCSNKGTVDVKLLLRWAQMISIIIVSALIVGRVEEELTLTLNRDGSGTLNVRIKVDDRIMVHLEAKAAAPAEEMKGPRITRWDAPLLLQPEEATLRKMLSPDFEITHFESLIDGEVREVNFSCTWVNPDVFDQPVFAKLVRLTPKVTREGKGNIRVDLFDGRIPGQGRSDPSFFTIPDAYVAAKGFRRLLTLNMPGMVQSASGRLSKESRQVTWDIDLRDRTKLPEVQKLVDALSPYNVEAIFDPADFEESAIQAWSIAPTTLETSTTGDQSSPSDAEVCPCKLFAESIRMGRASGRTYKRDDINIIISELAVHYGTWCGMLDNFKALDPLKTSNIEILEVLDRHGEEISSMFFDPREGHVNGLIATLQLKEGDEFPEIAKIRSRVIFTMHGEIIPLSLTAGQLRAMAGKEETGIPLLDENKVLVESIKGSRITFTNLPDNDASIAPRVSSVSIMVDGEKKTLKGTGESFNSKTKQQSFDASLFDDMPDDTTVLVDIVMDGATCEAFSEFEVPNL